jgi:hypothetical protein
MKQWKIVSAKEATFKEIEDHVTYFESVPCEYSDHSFFMVVFLTHAGTFRFWISNFDEQIKSVGKGFLAIIAKFDGATRQIADFIFDHDKAEDCPCIVFDFISSEIFMANVGKCDCCRGKCNHVGGGGGGGLPKPNKHDDKPKDDAPQAWTVN